MDKPSFTWTPSPADGGKPFTVTFSAEHSLRGAKYARQQTLIIHVSAAPPTADEILIPAGNFQMGCDNSRTPGCYAAQLLHTVYLDAYYIDKYEVTNNRYRACVDAAICAAPSSLNDFRNVIFGEYPVTGVDWYQAKAFCTWEGKRLPTEAEWEKAARGSTDTRTYPWGDQRADCTLANFTPDGESECVRRTSRVGSYPAGASPYGVMDMAGNALEWVNEATRAPRVPFSNDIGTCDLCWRSTCPPLPTGEAPVCNGNIPPQPGHRYSPRQAAVQQILP